MSEIMNRQSTPAAFFALIHAVFHDVIGFSEFVSTTCKSDRFR
jgi:hypothetical protein